jgi:hypothetical protein
MPNTGVFDDLEQEIVSSAHAIALILEKYSSSQSGKAQIATFSGVYYLFFKDLWEGIDQIGSLQSDLLKTHLIARLSLDLNILGTVLYRSFRRALYCRCFNGIELAQMKQAGLYAYWISKLRPVVIGKAPEDLEGLSNDLERGVQEINERFAFHIVNAFYKVEFGKSLLSCADYQSHFVHAIKYRSFTEDSMMLVTESLGAVGDTNHAIF